MGLDVMVFTEIEVSTEEKSNMYLYNDESFKAVSDELQNGWYEGFEEMVFRAGSYGTYGAFRERLCNLALGKSLKYVWDNADEFKNAPFIELLDFSDCDGFFGPTTSAKLGADFKKFEDKANSLSEDPEEREYFAELFKNFKDAFEVAGSDNGVVVFM